MPKRTRPFDVRQTPRFEGGRFSPAIYQALEVSNTVSLAVTTVHHQARCRVCRQLVSSLLTIGAG